MRGTVLVKLISKIMRNFSLGIYVIHTIHFPCEFHKFVHTRDALGCSCVIGLFTLRQLTQEIDKNAELALTSIQCLFLRNDTVEENTKVNEYGPTYQYFMVIHCRCSGSDSYGSGGSSKCSKSSNLASFAENSTSTNNDINK